MPRCFNQACGKEVQGNRRCGACNIASYCNRKCQRADSQARHKSLCPEWQKTPPSEDDLAAQFTNLDISQPTQPSNIPSTPAEGTFANGWIIRAEPSIRESGTSVLDNIASQIAPWHFDPIGNEASEKRQLIAREGWSGVIEVGKFYDHAGCDQWYYYVYGPTRAFDKRSGKPKNEVASLVCYQLVYGDVVVVTSGPMGSNWPVEIKKEDLVKTMEWYKGSDVDREKVFQEREYSRAMKKMGLDGTNRPHGFISIKM